MGYPGLGIRCNRLRACILSRVSRRFLGDQLRKYLSPAVGLWVLDGRRIRRPDRLGFKLRDDWSLPLARRRDSRLRRGHGPCPFHGIRLKDP